MGNRHRAREYALQILFQFDFNDGEPRRLMEAFWRDLRVPDEIVRFCEERVEGVLAHREELDAMIAAASENWRLDRMTGVDRNVLRIALFEVLYCPDVPKNVIINEAVEIGKRFGTEDSGAFINGILDRIASERRGPEVFP
jgi:N utilization substance protein B